MLGHVREAGRMEPQRKGCRHLIAVKAFEGLETLKAVKTVETIDAVSPIETICTVRRLVKSFVFRLARGLAA